MPAPQNLRATGDRIELLLDRLHSQGDRASCERAEELLRLVTDLYGAALARVIELARREPPILDALVSDELVASLLIVHGLHPVSLAERVEGALEQVRPLLEMHAGDVELLHVDAAAGVVYLRLLGSCDGCPSSAVTLQGAVERGDHRRRARGREDRGGSATPVAASSAGGARRQAPVRGMPGRVGPDMSDPLAVLQRIRAAAPNRWSGQASAVTSALSRSATITVTSSIFRRAPCCAHVGGVTCCSSPREPVGRATGRSRTVM